jgi:hypothetical protein
MILLLGLFLTLVTSAPAYKCRTFNETLVISTLIGSTWLEMDFPISDPKAIVCAVTVSGTRVISSSGRVFQFESFGWQQLGATLVFPAPVAHLAWCNENEISVHMKDSSALTYRYKHPLWIQLENSTCA